MPTIVLLMLLFLLPAGASAQVYKCKGKSGETAYSEHPCDASAQPMKLRDERPAASPPPPPMESATPEPSPLREGDSTPAPAAELDRTAERECIANATASIYGPSNDRVATYQQQMTMLNEQLGNAVDAQRSEALQVRMANLRRAISREHAYAHEQVNTARRRCVDQYRAATP